MFEEIVYDSKEHQEYGILINKTIVIGKIPGTYFDGEKRIEVLLVSQEVYNKLLDIVYPTGFAWHLLHQDMN